MPYGIRTRAKRSNPYVRAQTICWLQSEYPDAKGYLPVTGLSPGRRMVSFVTPASSLERFEAVHFSADSHDRLGFATLQKAREAAHNLNERAVSMLEEVDVMTQTHLQTANPCSAMHANAAPPTEA